MTDRYGSGGSGNRYHDPNQYGHKEDGASRAVINITNAMIYRLADYYNASPQGQLPMLGCYDVQVTVPAGVATDGTASPRRYDTASLYLEHEYVKPGNSPLVVQDRTITSAYFTRELTDDGTWGRHTISFLEMVRVAGGKTVTVEYVVEAHDPMREPSYTRSTLGLTDAHGEARDDTRQLHGDWAEAEHARRVIAALTGMIPSTGQSTTQPAGS